MSATTRAARSERAMALSGHLRELRRRGMVAAAAVVVAAMAGWVLTGPVLEFLSAPIVHAGTSQDRTAALNFDSVTGAFELRLKLAVQTGLILAAPVWLYQIFAFIVPGLNRTERRASIGFVLAAVPLFVSGGAAGVLVLPHMVELLTAFAPPGSSSLLQASVYYEFVLKLVLAMGIAFVLPVFLVILNALGITSGKAILGSWRWAILAICTFTAIATPAADVLAMFLLAVPMTLLYFTAAAIALIRDRHVAARLRLAVEQTPTAAS